MSYYSIFLLINSIETTNDEYDGVSITHYGSLDPNLSLYERCDIYKQVYKGSELLLFSFCPLCIYTSNDMCNVSFSYKNENDIKKDFRYSEYYEVRISSIINIFRM